MTDSAMMCVVFKEGCKLPREVFSTPHVSRMIEAALAEAPQLVDDVMMITSVYRDGPGYHPKCRAIDIRTGLTLNPDGGWLQHLRAGAIFAGQGGYSVACRWADRIRFRLGREFDVVYGSDANHVNHIHIEHDRKKELATHAAD